MRKSFTPTIAYLKHNYGKWNWVQYDHVGGWLLDHLAALGMSHARPIVGKRKLCKRSKVRSRIALCGWERKAAFIIPNVEVKGFAWEPSDFDAFDAIMAECVATHQFYRAERLRHLDAVAKTACNAAKVASIERRHGALSAVERMRMRFK